MTSPAGVVPEPNNTCNVLAADCPAGLGIQASTLGTRGGEGAMTIESKDGEQGEVATDPGAKRLAVPLEVTVATDTSAANADMLNPPDLLEAHGDGLQNCWLPACG